MGKIYKTKNDDNVYKRLRLQKGLTQVEVSNLLSVRQTAVSKWECGSTIPDQALLPKIAELYETTVDYLLGRDEVKPSHSISPRQQQVAEIIKKATEETGGKYDLLTEEEKKQVIERLKFEIDLIYKKK